MRESGVAKSTSEARRLILQGGVRLNGEKVEDADVQVPTQGEKILQVGRRRIMKIIFAQSPTMS
jgi:tyrosyl-tRNA synthetase